MEVIELSLELLLILFFVSIIAGLLDTLAGGGGLITIPALLLSGMPPLYALGTNKLQGCVGTGVATFVLLKKRKLKWVQIKKVMITAFIGSVFGTIFVQYINSETLSFIIPIVLFIIAAYFTLYDPNTRANNHSKIKAKKYAYTIIPAIGFYDGMFGPGTGSFFSLSAVIFRGKNLVKSTVFAKPMNFSTNIASLIIFIISGHIVWVLGGVMMIGQAIGGWLGSHYIFKVKPEYLRIVVVTMCVLMLIKYLL